MKRKVARIIVIVVGITASLLLYQNLTPSELDVSLNSALSDQAKTADAIKENVRSPASISTAEPYDENTSESE